MNNSTDRISAFAMKIAEPLSKLGNIKGVKAVTMGLMSCMPLTIIGSVFILLNLFSVPGSMGAEGFALLPFLEPIAGKFMIVYNLSLNFMAFWCAITIAQNYAELNGYDPKISGMVGLFSFMIIATMGPESNALATNNFGAKGLIVAMLCAVLFTKLYIFLDRKNIKIKMPDSVPPYIGESFGGFVPMLIIAALALIIRHILNIDVATIVSQLLAPFTVAAENSLVMGAFGILNNMLWFCGLHGGSLTGAVLNPLKNLYLAENVAAKAAGELILPHVWCGYALGAVNFAGSFYALTFLLNRSKVKHLNALGKAAAVPVLFNIQEPLVFGVPLVFNGYLIIPWILANFINGQIAWYLSWFNVIGRSFANVSWACPSFLALPLSTGDVKSLILIPIAFIIALLIWTPFFKAYEKSEIERMTTEESAE